MWCTWHLFIRVFQADAAALEDQWKHKLAHMQTQLSILQSHVAKAERKLERVEQDAAISRDDVQVRALFKPT